MVNDNEYPEIIDLGAILGKFFIKKLKKIINILIAFSFFYKSSIKTFLNWFINICPEGTG